MSMMNRRLGRTRWRVSEIGYGGWQIGGTMWGAIGEDQARAAVDAALDSGTNFFDTALAYGQGRSERVLGAAIKESGERDRVRIATKVPPMNLQWPARADSAPRDVFPADWIRECAHRSQENLGGDPIDLLQLHVWTDAWNDDDEWFDTLSALRDEGIIRAFGVSVNDHDPSSALEVTKSGKVDTIQVIYNVFDQTPEADLFLAAKDNEVGVVVRVPLDEGSLGGGLRRDTVFAENDMRRKYFKGERLAEVVKRIERLRPLLETADQTLAQGALRFCLSHPAVSTVIVGSVDPEHIHSNARVSAAGPLDTGTRIRLKSHAWSRNFYP